MVDRYSFEDSEDDGGHPVRVDDLNGEYVFYQDYEDLERELVEAKHEYDMLVRDIRRLV